MDNNGNLIGHPPDITLKEYIRDKSYILSKLFSILEAGIHHYSSEDSQDSLRLYESLIRTEAYNLIEKGVLVVIAYSGIKQANRMLTDQMVKQTFSRLCHTANPTCLSLDTELQDVSDTSIFLADGVHWNKQGHGIVAKVMRDFLETAIARQSQ